jgi:hypothetical protein
MDSLIAQAIHHLLERCRAFYQNRKFVVSSSTSSSRNPCAIASHGATGNESMGNIIGRSAGWGAVFGAIAAFTTAACLLQYWASAKTGHPGDLITLMILWVPPVTIMGGVAATVLFAVVGAIMSFKPAGIEPSALSYAVLGSLLALGIVILPFGSWVAGGLLRALQGAQGTYLLLPIGLLPVAIAGLLTGWRVESSR